MQKIARAPCQTISPVMGSDGQFYGWSVLELFRKAETSRSLRMVFGRVHAELIIHREFDVVLQSRSQRPEARQRVNSGQRE
jgi:hypothetical protein